MDTQVLLVLFGVFGGVSNAVSVLEGQPVTLPTDVKMDPQQDIKWYFGNIRIAQINGDLSIICTDVRCKDGPERFRGRLKLDNQTGSLTIIKTRITDSGNYTLEIISSGNHHDKIFSVRVDGFSPAPRNEVKRLSVKAGESVTLVTDEIRKPNDGMMIWHFNDTLIAEIIGGQSKVCTDDQCKERFGGRLKLNDHTGSLTITNIKTKQAGFYELQIVNNTSSIRRRRRASVTSKSFHVNVFAVDSGWSSATVGAVCAAAVVIAAVAGCMYSRRHQARSYDMQRPEVNGATHVSAVQYKASGSC